MIKNFLITLFTSLTLAACGGGDTGSSSNPNTLNTLNLNAVATFRAVNDSDSSDTFLMTLNADGSASYDVNGVKKIGEYSINGDTISTSIFQESSMSWKVTQTSGSTVIEMKGNAPGLKAFTATRT